MDVPVSQKKYTKLIERYQVNQLLDLCDSSNAITPILFDSPFRLE